MRKIGLFILILTFCLSQHTHAQKKKKRRAKAIKTVVQTAYSFKGTPYRYGGTTKSGIDCSALMQNSFSKAGIKIPRTAKEQSKFGKKVGWGNIKKGDIVFFKFKSKKEKWYHSGLITSVEGSKISFIHASTSKGVVISDLNADYYKKNVKAFRRVVK
jgi:cell wall-associated NlpC family hydrolase